MKFSNDVEKYEIEVTRVTLFLTVLLVRDPLALYIFHMLMGNVPAIQIYNTIIILYIVVLHSENNYSLGDA